MHRFLSIILAICLLMGYVPAAAYATSNTCTAQASGQSSQTTTIAPAESNHLVQSWDELMDRMETVHFPLSGDDELFIYKMAYVLEDYFVEGTKREVLMPLPVTEYGEECDRLMHSITRLVRLFNDAPNHYWFVEWDPVYHEDGTITIKLSISMDRQKFPVNRTGIAKLLTGSCFYESAWGFGSGKSNIWNDEHWAYNEDCLVFVCGVSHLRENGSIYATDTLCLDSPIGNQDPIRFSTLLPGSHRYLLVCTLVDGDIVVLGYTCSGNVRTMN